MQIRWLPTLSLLLGVPICAAILGCGGKPGSVASTGTVADAQADEKTRPVVDQQTATKGAGGGANAVAGLQKLLDPLPKESHPRSGTDRVLERNKANKWVEQNVVGKPLTLSIRLGDVSISPSFPKGDTYTAEVVLGEVIENSGDGISVLWGSLGTVRVGASEWQVYMLPCKFQKLDEAAAIRLRDAKGNQVTVHGVLAGNTNFLGHNVSSGFMQDLDLYGQTVQKGPLFWTVLKDVTIEGVVTPQK